MTGLLALAAWAWTQGRPGHGDTVKPATPATGGQAQTTGAESEPLRPIRIPMDELHRQGGIPPGWQFRIPSGNAAEGKKVYVELECFSCHEIKGEQFPQASKDPDRVGPELTGIGRHHPAEYLAETIVNPNRVILEAPGFTGPDGLSKMPDYSESLTLRQLIDLVAYLKSLTTGEHGGHSSGRPTRPGGSAKPTGPSGEHSGKAH